jgi:hypothetical protein
MQSIPVVTRFIRSGTRKRLWMAGTALGVFLLTLVIGNQFLSTDRSVTSQMLGHDFLAFYTAGAFVRDGRVSELYNLDSVRDFEQSTASAAGLEVGKSFGPWWNPPFYALVFEPLAQLPYRDALNRWRWINLFSVAIAIALLSSIVMQSSLSTSWQHWMLVPLLVVISMPFIQALSHGQNTFTSLLVLTVATVLWREKRKFLAGVTCGLLFYKPQLGAVVAVAMVLDLGWTALGGIAVTGIFLALTTLIALPGSLADWLHQLPVNVRWMQVEHAYLWERHVTLKAFWRLLLQGREAGAAGSLTSALTWISEFALAGALLWAGVHRLLKANQDPGGASAARNWFVACSDQRLSRDRFISATIVSMPLMMPFYFDYDLLLLAVPATLYAAERIAWPQRVAAQDGWFTARWVALYLWLFINPAFALHTHISASVILLSTIAIESIVRINRADQPAVAMLIIRPQQTALAA